jgi:Ca2+-transporting ATPase
MSFSTTHCCHRNDYPARHAEPPEAVAASLSVDPADGLDKAEATIRLANHGLNQLVGKLPRPAWLKFFDQFRNFLVIVLLGAAGLAGSVGDIKDAVIIGIVVLFNATLGFIQEHRAEAALAALKNMLAPTARVRRNGQVTQILATDFGTGRCLIIGIW